MLWRSLSRIAICQKRFLPPPLHSVALRNCHQLMVVPNGPPIDDLLRQAHVQPGKRMEFYRALMEKDRKIFLALASKPDATMHAPLTAHDMRLPRLTMDGTDYIPFFSSLVHLKVPFHMELDVRKLFELARDHRLNLMLNPTSDMVHKLFSWQEISAILDGSLFSDAQIVQFGSEQQLSVSGLPIDSPALQQLTTDLANHFSNSGIKRCWLARHGSPSATLIATEAAQQDFDRVMSGVGPIINAVRDLPFDGLVDVYRVDFDGLSHAFLSGEYGEPFYLDQGSPKKSWTPFLAP